jgi:capsule polysaccharide export protein KpsE/RkpR
MAASNIAIVRVLSGKWKHITIVALSALVVSVIISMPFIMEPRYKSEAVVYPANLAPFSLESPTEQLMQLLQSRTLKAKVLRDQQLWKTYKLDTLDPKFDFYFTQLFDENIRFNQTRFESVIIEVYDKDPVKAQQINASVIKCVDQMVKKLHDDKTAEFVEMYGLQLSKKRKSIDSVDQAMQELRNKYGILDYEIQAKEASKNYYQALASGKSPNSLTALNEEIRQLRENGGRYRVMDEMLAREIKQYELIKKEYEEKIRDIEKKFSYTSIVSNPNIPVTKSWPVRWLISLISVLSAVFVACLYYVISDRIKKSVNT